MPSSVAVALPSVAAHDTRSACRSSEYGAKLNHHEESREGGRYPAVRSDRGGGRWGPLRAPQRAGGTTGGRGAVRVVSCREMFALEFMGVLEWIEGLGLWLGDWELAGVLVEGGGHAEPMLAVVRGGAVVSLPPGLVAARRESASQLQRAARCESGSKSSSTWICYGSDRQWMFWAVDETPKQLLEAFRCNEQF
eukprot:1180959-Prorocentrum_minimum.AAC.2